MQKGGIGKGTPALRENKEAHSAKLDRDFISAQSLTMDFQCPPKPYHPNLQIEETKQSVNRAVHGTVQSNECKLAEFKHYKFWNRVIQSKEELTYLRCQGADRSPPPKILSPQLAKKVGNVIHFNAGHLPTKITKNSFVNSPTNDGPACFTSKIICYAVNSSLHGESSLTFGKTFDNFDNLLSFKAPYFVNGDQFDFDKHVL
jgi:hypothetical protein